MKQDEETKRRRRFRSIAEKRQIVQLTLEPGASVAKVARAHDVNANLVFCWRRSFERGELNESGPPLLPVSVDEAPHQRVTSGAHPDVGSIHIEISGRARISIGSGADIALVRQVLEILRR